mgnify:CR=1 FL=1
MKACPRLVRGLVCGDGSVCGGFDDGSAVLMSCDGSGLVCLEASVAEGGRNSGMQ